MNFYDILLKELSNEANEATDDNGIINELLRYSFRRVIKY